MVGRTLLPGSVQPLAWCKACAVQAAGLQRVYDRYKGRGVEVLAIHVDDTEGDARAFLEAHHATYDCTIDPSFRVANRFGVKRVPYTVIVNKRGEIAARLDATADEARLGGAIETALKPPVRRRSFARPS